MSYRDVLIIADAVAPLAEGESPLAAIGLSRALAAAGHRTTVLSLGDAASVAKVPGLARRLRTIKASIGEQSLDLTLYEGKASLSAAELLIVGAAPDGRSQTAALLGSAVKSLAEDGLVAPAVTIGWGETAAIVWLLFGAQRTLQGAVQVVPSTVTFKPGGELVIFWGM